MSATITTNVPTMAARSTVWVRKQLLPESANIFPDVSGRLVQPRPTQAAVARPVTPDRRAYRSPNSPSTSAAVLTAPETEDALERGRDDATTRIHSTPKTDHQRNIAKIVCESSAAKTAVAIVKGERTTTWSGIHPNRARSRSSTLARRGRPMIDCPTLVIEGTLPIVDSPTVYNIVAQPSAARPPACGRPAVTFVNSGLIG